MTDPIDYSSIANFDPIDVQPEADERDPYVWESLAARLDEATRTRLIELGKSII